jgi:hypothetical protein
MLWSEVGVVPKVAFCFTWGLLNFFWLAVLRRPAVAAALSLVMIVVLILLSWLKYEIIRMTANFLDVVIINSDTVGFLLAIKPDLEGKVLLALALVLPALTLLWWVDPFRVRLRMAATGFAVCAAALLGMALAFPQEEWDAFAGDGYVSKFSRSGVAAMSELVTHGYMESDAAITDRLKTLPIEICAPQAKPPHIILVHDESSFDIRAVPGVKVAADYGGYFRSFDGKRRHFIVEGAGGPSWYSEYNVLAGLSARSFGRFAYYVTQIAAGRVERGLPTALRRCGYRTFSIYPALGAAHDRTRAREGADVPVRLSGSEPLPLELSLAARPHAGMEESGKCARCRRISAPPEHELPRLRGAARSPRARLSRRALPLGPLRRSPAGFRLLHARARARRARDQPAADDL